MMEHFNKKYKKNLSQKSHILPIYKPENDDIEGLSSASMNNRKIRIVYAGGTQIWQNIELMFESIETCMRSGHNDQYEFFLFFPQTSLKEVQQKYSKIVNMPNVFVDSLPKSEVMNILKSADFGFVLRDDILVNRVACPTKLIEYLEFDVIPIVKSPHIGDFYNLGYQYIEIETNFKIDKEIDITNMLQANRKVLKTFQARVKHSQDKLIEILGNCE